MSVTRIKNSSIKNKGPKYDNVLAGLPYTPTIGTATDGGTGSTATVAFTANGNPAGLTYTALSTPGSFTGTGTTSPITITGLSSGTAYTFQVNAANANGTSAYSAASNSVTPVVPSSYESIATYTVSGSSTSSFTFSSIPSTYRSLQIRGIARTGGNDTLWMRLNGDTGTNYSGHALKGASDGTVGTDANANANKINPIAWAVGTASMWGASIIDIDDYTSTTRNKTIRAFFGADNNASTGAGYIYVASGNWRSTSAVDSVTIASDSILTAGTTFALYGIKG